jgi:hypothetical protein
MSPAPSTLGANVSASPPAPSAPPAGSPINATTISATSMFHMSLIYDLELLIDSCIGPSPPQNFDDIFHKKFMAIIQAFRENPESAALTQKDRKNFIQNAYMSTDSQFFGNRSLTDNEIKMRALTKVFYKVLAEEPWSDEWIRPHDVERKLSRWELHTDSVDLAAQHGLFTPRDCIAAARMNEAALARADAKTKTPRGPYDDIEIIYVPGTVSSKSTNAINRDTTYPVSVASVAHTLYSHICRDMVRPYAMAEMFVTCNDTEKLLELRTIAWGICDFAPHLLDNDNISLLIVLLILTRSEICRRFRENGIRIEGSTISHRRAECMKQKLGWRTSEDRKPFDNVANEFQTRLKNAANPAPRAHPRHQGRRPSRKSSTSATPATPAIGYYPSPQVRNNSLANLPMPIINHNNVNSGINIPAPRVPDSFRYPAPPSLDPNRPRTAGSLGTNGTPALSSAVQPLTTVRISAGDPMDIS